jgi:hypothetical protein
VNLSHNSTIATSHADVGKCSATTTQLNFNQSCNIIPPTIPLRSASFSSSLGSSSSGVSDPYPVSVPSLETFPPFSWAVSSAICCSTATSCSLLESVYIGKQILKRYLLRCGHLTICHGEVVNCSLSRWMAKTMIDFRFKKKKEYCRLIYEGSDWQQ